MALDLRGGCTVRFYTGGTVQVICMFSFCFYLIAPISLPVFGISLSPSTTVVVWHVSFLSRRVRVLVCVRDVHYQCVSHMCSVYVHLLAYTLVFVYVNEKQDCVGVFV